jgi:hypothetical protein
MKLHRCSIVGALLGVAAVPALACYTVYDSSQRVVYQSERPPVDMSRPIHETLPARFPGGHMVFEAAGECPVINSVAMGSGGRTLSSVSPLLTDQKTARALGLAHRVLPSGAAVVAPRDVSLPPGVTVLPGTRPSLHPSLNPTAVMGAAPR